ncbi:MAG: bifunctional methylenetetrahydrofolate dehydrogenase/methenyltetrahydrofolate cyclohydrolase FolD [Candidatus Thermoplasmatota archaeon]|nr:bifunctional methylenetetrahydrofolate dehydrogenase/methenyltetrahydrofolate cyclohydrolase FolD [Candidatus Thermoplasmatota archaeon]
MSQVLDGNAVAQAMRHRVQAAVEHLRDEHGFQPRLDAILVGDDEASKVYVRMKRKDCQEVGIESRLWDLPEDTTQDELIGLVRKLNEDPECDGILVQLPLPDHIDEHDVLEATDPSKDADGFHPINLGRLVADRAGLTPATPTGILELLDQYDIDLTGKHAVVIGRSTIVGKPMALLMLQRGIDATLTVCHSRTENLADVCRQADVLVAAVGQPRMVQADWVSEGAIVIDVGINRVDGALVGDVDYETVAKKASYITPVPGGVGPLTRAQLLVNVVQAACERRGIPVPEGLITP